ncbi:MAG: hypothetical protein ACPGAN_06015 [Candidatus Poseidoniaceae archaeon]
MILLFIFAAIPSVNQLDSNAAIFDSSDNLDYADVSVNIYDDQGMELDCSIFARNPWSQLILSQATGFDSVMQVRVGAGIMIDADCEGYSVPYQMPIIIEDDLDISITANQISRHISINSGTEVTSYEIKSITSDFTHSSNQNSAEFASPANESLEVVAYSNQTVVGILRISGASNENLSIELPQLSSDFSSFENPNPLLEYRIYSPYSTELVELNCDSYCNTSLPQIFTYASNLENLDSPYYVSALSENNLINQSVSLTNEPDLSIFQDFDVQAQAINSMAKLNFNDANESSNTVNAQYTESMFFDYRQGIPSLPYSNLGIQRQSELLFQKEVSEVIQNLTWMDSVSNLCCTYDLRIMDVTSNNFTIFDNPGTDFSGSWGWDYQMEMLAYSRGLNSVRLGIIYGNDLRQQVPLEIDLHNELEYYTSNGQQWISGDSSNFMVIRNQTSIAGEMVITLKQNIPPKVSATAVTEGNYVLSHGIWPTDLEVDYRLDIEDGYLSDHTCISEVRTISDVILTFTSTEFSVPKLEDYIENESEFSIHSTCVDENNLTGSLVNNFSLDSQPPLLDMLQSDVGCSTEFTWLNETENSLLPNANFCNFFMVNPGSAPRFIVSASDDSSEHITATWTSNVSQDWSYTGNFLQEVWREAAYANSASDDVESRRGEAPITAYELVLTLTDQVGHQTQQRYEVILRSTYEDVRIIPKLKIWTDEGWSTTNAPKISDTIILDLSDSFHPHLSIDDFDFTVEKSYVAGADSLTAELPGLNSSDLYLAFNISDLTYVDGSKIQFGVHEFTVLAAYDNSEITTEVEANIYPQKPPVLEVERILTDGDLDVGLEQFNVVVVNSGSSPTEAKLCIGDDCVYYYIAGWSPTNQGYTIVPIEAQTNPSQVISVEIRYDLTDEFGQLNGKSGELNYDSDLRTPLGISAIEIAIVLVLLSAIIGFIINTASTKPGRDSGATEISEEE